MVKFKKNKGFTLVEMLVTITILGIVTVISLPILSSISGTMKGRKIEVVKNDVLSASKLYIDARAEDEFGNQETGCVMVPFSTLVNMKLMDADALDGYDVDPAKVYVLVRKAQDVYTYELKFPMTEEEIADAANVDNMCNPDAKPEDRIDNEGPKIELKPNKTNGTIKSVEFNNNKKYVVVEFSDYYGLGKNISFTYSWIKIENGTETKVIEKSIDLENKTKKPTEDNPSVKETYKIDIPKTSGGVYDSGDYKLIIHPTNVWDAIGNFTTADVISEKYQFDNIKPTVVIKLRQSNSTGSVKYTATDSDITDTSTWAEYYYYVDLKESKDNYSIVEQTWRVNKEDRVSFYDTIEKTETYSAVTDKLLKPSARYAEVKMCDHAKNCRTQKITVNVSPMFTFKFKKNANDATGSMDDTVCYYKHECKLRALGFSRTGYDFKGWKVGSNTLEDKKDVTNYTDKHGIEYEALAQWEEKTYNVTYNKNTSDTVSGMPSNQVKKYFSNLPLSSNTPTRSGYTFVGWNSNSNAHTSQYAAGATYSTNENITLYAIWKSNTTYKVTFKVNKAGWMSEQEASCTPYNNESSCKVTAKNISACPGQSDTSPKYNYKDIFSYKGWSTDSNASSATYSQGSEMNVSSDMTVYAIVTLAKTLYTVNDCYYWENGYKHHQGLTMRDGPSGNWKYTMRDGATFQATDWKYTGGDIWLKGYQRGDYGCTIDSHDWPEKGKPINESTGKNWTWTMSYGGRGWYSHCACYYASGTWNVTGSGHCYDYNATQWSKAYKLLVN